MTDPVDPGAHDWTPPPPTYSAPVPPAPPVDAPGQLGYTPQQPPGPTYGEQPYAGQPYAGQPYPGQPYPAQPYPGPTYPAQPYPGQPYPGYYETPPEPPRRNTRRWIALGVVVVAAAVVAVVITNSSNKSSPSSKTLSLPNTIGSYARYDDATTDRLRSTFATEFGTTGTLGNFFSTAAIGTYSQSGSDPPAIILIVDPASTAHGLGPSQFVGGSSSSAITNFPAGSHGGELLCFTQSIATLHETICGWSDSKTVGYLLALNAGLTKTQLATLSNGARDTLDH